MAKKRSTDPRTTAFYKKLSSHSSSRQYLNGEDVYSQGEIANSLFRIETGNVKLCVESTRGKKAVISILRAGDCFGEACLFGEVARGGSATCIGKSTIGRISKSSTLGRLRDDPSFTTSFVAHLLQRIGRVEADLVDQLVNSSERRLARLLMRLSNADEFTGHATAVAFIDQGTLAQMVGTTRSRVSHFMNEFRQKKMIDYNGDLHVHKALMDFLRSTET
jgi:CRP/FNR family transcriptional regulator, cyclic AMP receptor protein